MFIFDVAREMFTLNALYIDPSAATVLLTSISGVVIAVGATAVVLWRKAKKRRQRCFTSTRMQIRKSKRISLSTTKNNSFKI